jgi:hypothetical protein
LIEETLMAARALAHKADKVRSLAKISPYLPEPERRHILQEALRATQLIGDEEILADVLIELTPKLPEAMLPQALTIARKVGHVNASGAKSKNEEIATIDTVMDQSVQAVKQVRISRHLFSAEPDQLIRKILAAAQELDKAEDRAIAMLGLIPHLPKVELQKTLQGLLVTAELVRNEEDRADVLIRSAPYLGRGLQGAALAIAQSIKDEEIQAKTLIHLAILLPQIPESEALAVVLAIRDEKLRGEGLVRLVPYLSETLRSEVLASAQAIEGERVRARTLAGLVPHLPEAQKCDVLSGAYTIKDAEGLSEVLFE